MTDLVRYAAALDGVAGGGLPPVEAWDPPFCGDSGVVIRRDGVWVHDGTPIARAALVRLFSTVLRRDGDDYFLVTPAEKVSVQVEDAPFLAVLLEADGDGRGQTLTFVTNVGDRVVVDADHALTYRDAPVGLATDGRAPYLHVRRGLEARVARAAYYDLVERGELAPTGDGGADDAPCFGVWSRGIFFPFATADEVFPDA
ncbi:MAG: DUF1285 domain-containing protein [Parvularculaceae bacterium]